MAPKRLKKKVTTTVVKSMRKVIIETVDVSVEGAHRGASTLEARNEEVEGVQIQLEQAIKIVPVEEIRKDEVSAQLTEKKTQEEAVTEKGERSASKKAQRRDRTPLRERARGRTENKKGKKKRAGGDDSSYKKYVFQVLREVHPEMRISFMAMSVVNSLMNDMFQRISCEAAKLSDLARRKTMTSREIQAAVKLVLPGDLGKHAVAEGTKAITNYRSYEGDGNTG